jgi:hypothetical protein
LNELFTDNIINLFTLLQITRLNILYHGFFVGILINLLHHLPDLHTLGLWSLSLQKIPYVSDEQALDILCVLSKRNKITRINIQSLTELSQLEFLLDLCPNIQYLQIDGLDNIDFKLFLRFILTKQLNHITLCLHSPTANDTTIDELHDMIHSKKLCHDYRIKHSYNKIYLQWK